MADNDGYTAKQMLLDTLQVSGQASLSDMYARAKELERYSLGLRPAGRPYPMPEEQGLTESPQFRKKA